MRDDELSLKVESMLVPNWLVNSIDAQISKNLDAVSVISLPVPCGHPGKVQGVKIIILFGIEKMIE